ncbi:hypothetical protein A2935_02250 [Candidatus Wolfebacteria bacterium RIFCSPLOWO2_01_FULL_47_17b]|nr:MAG: hypothetical protein A2935_02250 [Candidatus Wolfebacteria bacterium RIFCSPLOWO2_01_FULL_47_17b]
MQKIQKLQVHTGGDSGSCFGVPSEDRLRKPLKLGPKRKKELKPGDRYLRKENERPTRRFFFYFTCIPLPKEGEYGKETALSGENISSRPEVWGR